MPKLILASGSPRRRDLLGTAGFEFEIQVSAAEELDDPRLSPAALTETNANIKAAPVAQENSEAVVIGADTLVFLDGRALGKPADMAAAEAMLAQLVGKTHQVYTGVALLHGADRFCFHVATDVRFRPLSPTEIRDYLGLIDPLDKAGAYAAQEHGEKIIAETRGSYSNVVGLPIDELAHHLASRFDIRPQMPDCPHETQQPSR